jgi:hypothetical protein
MSHLSPERLAALVDSEPTATEFAHLMACAPCTEELDAHRALVAMATSDRTSIGLPLTRWESISSALRDEGLITTPAAGAGRSNRRARAWLQAAAMVLVAAGGVAAGRYSAGATLVPGATASSPSTPRASDSVVFRSRDDALAAFTQAEAQYQSAAAYLAQQDSASRGAETPSAMRTRLAALDRVAHTIREALVDAPYDPVLNGYHLTTLGQREATLRQLNTALPVGLRINTF